jgi:3-dehydroquinate synthase
VEVEWLSVKGACGISYPVAVGPGLLEDAFPGFVTEKGFGRVAVVSNDTVAPLYGEALVERIPGSFLISVPDGEQYKTPATIRMIYDGLLANGADRSTPVVVLGGGVIGDMAGFAAATFMRGVPLVQAPTSLLAMVDASIGGKVGFDLPQGKNLVGAFKDPLAVFADIETLDTLPPEEMRTGMSEVIKAGLIADPPLLDMLVPDDRKRMHYRDRERLGRIIRRAMAVKIGVVEQDRLEGGIRAYLNLGHTFAHALELVTDFRVTHGEAVAVGLVAAARLSERLSLCDGALVGRVESVVQSLRPADGPVGHPIPESGPEDLWAAMQHDKKWRNGRPRFVLLRATGEPVVVEDIPRDAVLEVLERIGEGFATPSGWT